MKTIPIMLRIPAWMLSVYIWSLALCKATYSIMRYGLYESKRRASHDLAIARMEYFKVTGKRLED